MRLCLHVCTHIFVAPHFHHCYTYQPGARGCWPKQSRLRWDLFANIPYSVTASSSEKTACADTQGWFEHQCWPWPCGTLCSGFSLWPKPFRSWSFLKRDMSRVPCSIPLSWFTLFSGQALRKQSFPWGQWRAKGFHQGLGICPENGGSQELAWRDVFGLSWGWGTEILSLSLYPGAWDWETIPTTLPAPAKKGSFSDTMILLFEREPWLFFQAVTYWVPAVCQELITTSFNLYYTVG